MAVEFSPTLHERSTSDGEFNELSKSLGFNIYFNVDNSQGDREYMEDYHQIAYQKIDDGKRLKYLYIGVFDGHSGKEAAKFAKENLLNHIVKLPYFWSSRDNDILRAIRDGYTGLQADMLEARRNWPTQNGFRSRAGTTASVIFLLNKKVYVGHVGDSGIVLGYYDQNNFRWMGKRLTVDHTPDKPLEKSRIERGGGKVIVYDGVPRILFKRESLIKLNNNITRRAIVETPLIAVARSLGDLWSFSQVSKEYIVSPIPDLSIQELNKFNDFYLIIASDGLWNRINGIGAVNIIHTAIKKGFKKSASRLLLRQVYQPWISGDTQADNITIIIVAIESLERKAGSQNITK